MAEIKIRPAKSGDEHAIASVHIRSWQEAHHGLIPQDYLDALANELEDRVKMWTNILANPQRWSWVVDGPNGIVGFVLFGPPRDPNREGFIELGAIYLLASENGKGIGFSLLSTGFNKMRDLGYKNAYCWVLESNPTIKFYERSGAKFSNKIKEDEIGGKQFKELAYEWNSFNH
jgi:GNAT superfamily N-acetyltransferase